MGGRERIFTRNRLSIR